MGRRTLEIPKLRAGGLVLGYRCSSRCRHCLYRSSPRRTDGGEGAKGALDAVLDQLAIRARDAVFHIGGGEPFLNLSLLGRAVRGMGERGLALDYVETNAAWARTRDVAHDVLLELADQGLEQILVSLSPFHAEFIPLQRTLWLVEEAERCLRRGAFVWQTSFLQDLSGTDPDQKLDFETMVQERGHDWARGLGERFGLVRGGRAGPYMARHGAGLPWRQAAVDPPCARRLRDTTHFHVDLEGNYVPGLCAGIQFPLALVPGTIDLAGFPVLQALLQDGPGALMSRALNDGFTPRQSYSSSCDLCTDVRTFCWGQGLRSGLGPAGFYEDGAGGAAQMGGL